MAQKPKSTRKQFTVKEFAPNLEKFDIPQRSSSSRGQVLRNLIKSNKKFLAVTLGILAVIFLVGFAIKTYSSLRQTRDQLAAISNDPNAKAKEEGKKIVEAVGKLVILPEGEEPTVATVTDPSKLSDQPFFVNSESGDKVLIYQEAQRAILYRPSENKVIEIAPLNTEGVSTGGVAGEDITNPAGDSMDKKPQNSSPAKNSNTTTNSNKSTNTVPGN